ncbi:MAG TPA: glycosyltransferase family 39 protein [Gemmatimonadaceae bacterium]|nr:glycosyltransferase family 39 protein [Gemmatimonadaceae bacterium]
MMRAPSDGTGWLRAWPRQIAVALFVIGVLLPVHSLAAALAGPAASGEHVAQLVVGMVLLKLALVAHAVLFALIPSVRLVPSEGQGLAPDTTVPASKPWSRAEACAAICILAVGVALRIPSLGRGLWFDEIQTYVDYVRHPLIHIVSTFDSQNQHMLYSMLARISVVLFGDSAWALRLPAVCLGVASLGALIWFGERVTSRREALLAATILAVSYHHVWFSQNARGYTGLLFFTLVGSGCFLLLLSDPLRHTWRNVAGYAVSMALANLIHVTAVFVTATHALVWLCLVIVLRNDLRNRAWRAPLAALVFAGTLSVLVYALVLPQFIATLMIPPDAGSATVWKEPVWMFTEGLRVLSSGIPGGLAAVAVVFIILGAGVASYWRRSVVVTTVMLLPAVVTGVAVMVLSHNLWPRFFFFSAGFAVLIAVRGGFAVVHAIVPGRASVPVSVGGALLVAAASLMTVPRAWLPKQDFGAAMSFVDSHRGPADVVAVSDMSSYVYGRYYHLPWTTVTSASDLAQVETRGTRTWMVLTFPVRIETGEPSLWARLSDSYRTVARFPGTVGGGDLYVMVSR